MLSTGQRSHAGVEDTRSRILVAARELFECNGTRGTTTREVAERAGVNEATLFRHFGSKRALLVAMREQACGTEQFRSVLASLPHGDLASDLRTIAYFVTDHMLAKRAMMCISLAENAAGADDMPEWRGPSNICSDLAAFFAAKIAAGHVRGDATLLARVFLSILFSYVVARKIWENGEPDRATLDGVVDIFINGASA